jgi:hypothetical protein
MIEGIFECIKRCYKKKNLGKELEYSLNEDLEVVYLKREEG